MSLKRKPQTHQQAIAAAVSPPPPRVLPPLPHYGKLAVAGCGLLLLQLLLSVVARSGRSWPLFVGGVAGGGVCLCCVLAMMKQRQRQADVSWLAALAGCAIAATASWALLGVVAAGVTVAASVLVLTALIHLEQGALDEPEPHEE